MNLNECLNVCGCGGRVCSEDCGGCTIDRCSKTLLLNTERIKEITRRATLSRSVRYIDPFSCNGGGWMSVGSIHRTLNDDGHDCESGCGECSDYDKASVDQDFFNHARQDVLDLCAEVERLKKLWTGD